ncbi:hypothetical protein [Lactiplantibacillus carotarum]|uniref:hypothetical protein n=1 Tax=Lactiplantibacillus carotarum TaxID=2993456 RepID=UPI00298EF373|nr:hypothetical protein [Lactiplantibacillus carotarum]
MQKKRFFLKGSDAETAWLNQQAARGYQLTAINGATYQFDAVQRAPQLTAEYLPVATLTAMADVFHPQATFTFRNGQTAVAYSPVGAATRTVKNDDHYRLAIYRRARELALNWMNGWVVGIWLLMCLGIVVSTQVTATPLLTNLLLGSFGVGAVLIAVGISFCVSAAVHFHKDVCRLIRLTGEDTDAWKPTFHVVFRNQATEPDTDQWGELGKWQLALQNQRGSTTLIYERI